MTTPVDSSVYYQGILWNSFDEVVAHIHRRAWGSPHGNWVEFVRRRQGRPFERVLSLNCGNGWLERALVEFDLARSVVAIDVLPDLLQEAEAASVGLPIEYHLMDTNLAQLPEGPFDAVVNHAAGRGDPLRAGPADHRALLRPRAPGAAGRGHRLPRAQPQPGPVRGAGGGAGLARAAGARPRRRGPRRPPRGQPLHLQHRPPPA